MKPQPELYQCNDLEEYVMDLEVLSEVMMDCLEDASRGNTMGFIQYLKTSEQFSLQARNFDTALRLAGLKKAMRKKDLATLHERALSVYEGADQAQAFFSSLIEDQ